MSISMDDINKARESGLEVEHTCTTELMHWYAVCLDCRRIIDDAPNGGMIHAAAEIHAKAREHEVIVGYAVRAKKAE